MKSQFFMDFSVDTMHELPMKFSVVFQLYIFNLLILVVFASAIRTSEWQNTSDATRDSQGTA